MRPFFLLFASLFIFFQTSLAADKVVRSLINKGNEQLGEITPLYSFALKNYLKAHDLLGEDQDADLEYNIGVCYLNTIDKTKAIPHLEAAYKLDPDISDEILYLLATAYHLNKEFDKAYKHYSKYKSTLDSKDYQEKKVSYLIANLFRDIRPTSVDLDSQVPIEGMGKVVAKRMKECKEGEKLLESPKKVEIKNIGIGINSAFPDYAPVISADEAVMFFTSRRDNSTGGNTTEYDGKYYEDVYVSIKIRDTWTVPENLGKPINDELHNSCIGLSANGETMFLYQVDEAHKGDIFISKLKGDVWGKPKRLEEGINTEFYERSASLSADERTLFFVSDRPKGAGGSDIYMVKKKADGTWDRPKNLGRKVNTAFDEDGVFFHPDGKTLYFSSKGHDGMGGFDIYKTTMDASGRFSSPVNLGYPINTPDDDIYFVLGASGEKGYYSSAKQGGKGEQDIYEIIFPKEEQEQKLTLLTGVITDAETNETLEAKVIIEDIGKNEVVGEITSNSKTGKYLIALPSGKNYAISVNKKGYLFHSENFNIAENTNFQKLQKDIALNKLKVGAKIVLNNIFFDFAKATLDSTSFAELDRVFALLKENPEINVEISGHTDNKGSADYNKKLSERRAETVVNYLVDKGITKERLTAKGYGPDRPIAPNSNKDGSDNEEGRALNRRTEFEILK